MITINEIAKLAKTSRSTVSRVLNDSGYVSEEAKERILKVIEKTGYVPSKHAKSLRTKKTNVIGVILPRLSTDTSNRMVNAINDHLALNGYQFILANTNLSEEKEIENIKLLRSRQVDGMILLATNISEKLIQTIEQLPIPLVALGQDLPGISVILNDDYHAARDMTTLLIEKGYEDIGFIGVTEEDHAVGYKRKQGYLDALKDHSLSIREEWMAEANFDFQSGYTAMKKIYEQSTKKPTAIFAVTDPIAIGAMQYLHEKDISIPNDIAVAGTGNSTVSRYISPSLTTIDFMNKDAGKIAAKLILSHIEDETMETKRVKMTYEIIERASI